MVAMISRSLSATMFPWAIISRMLTVVVAAGTMMESKLEVGTIVAEQAVPIPHLQSSGIQTDAQMWKDAAGGVVV